jgi:hypothetical protein
VVTKKAEASSYLSLLPVRRLCVRGQVLESMASVGQSFLSGQDMEGPLSTLTQLAQKTALVAGEEEGRSTLRDLLLHWGPRPDLPIALPPPTQGAEGSKGAAANVTPQPASQEVRGDTPSDKLRTWNT